MIPGRKTLPDIALDFEDIPPAEICRAEIERSWTDELGRKVEVDILYDGDSADRDTPIHELFDGTVQHIEQLFTVHGVNGRERLVVLVDAVEIGSYLKADQNGTMTRLIHDGATHSTGAGS
jgi:hypothetical protein